MRKVAKKCWNYLTQQRVRVVPAPMPAFTQPRVLDWVNSHPPSRCCVHPAKLDVISSPRKSGGVPYLDIYLCYQCNEEFSTKDTLQKHQVQCQGGVLPSAIPSTPPVSEAPSPAPPTCTPEDFSSGASGAVSPSSRSSVSQSQFVTALDLVPFHRARKIRQARRRNTECETIDLEEPQTPVSPSTPRSHKILITQLSRDASSNSLAVNGNSSCLGSRRSSCLRLSLDKKPEGVVTEKEEEKSVESDGDSCESNAEDTDEPKMRKKTLFSIDVSSGLGQRIIKHMTSEVHVPVISNIGEYCRTPIKDKYQDRLRNRQTTYPVTWKLTRKRQQQFCHLYKFTRADKLEFKEMMRTGLNLQSRNLRYSLPKCSVVVKRLSRKTLLKWNAVLQMSLTRQLLFQARAGFSQPSVFPEGPTFLLTDVDRVLGLKRKDGKPELARKLLASHCVSETTNAELQSQKLTVYRCLLTDLYSSVTSDGGQSPTGSRCQAGRKKTIQKYPALLSILSDSATGYKHPFHSKAADDASDHASVDVEKPLRIDIPSSAAGLLLPSEKCSPLDDSFSVKTLSSDEDMEKSFTCCSLCAFRDKCGCPLKEGAPPAAVNPVTCSLGPSSKVSSLSKASMSPPHLDPLSLTPKVSASSHPSLSPPTLSPVSQVGDTCLQSPGHRPGTRRSMLLLKTASFPRLALSPGHEQAAGVAGSDGFQSPAAPSPGRLVGRRDIKVTTRQSSPVSVKRTHSSPVFSRSTSLLQPVPSAHGHRPHTRSSAIQSALSGCLSPGKPSPRGCVSPACSSSTTAVKTPKDQAASSHSPLTPSSQHADNKKNAKSEGIHEGEKLPNTLQENGIPRSENYFCTESISPREGMKEDSLNTKVEASDPVEKKPARDKVQTRGSLQESTGDWAKRTEQREDPSDCKRLRSGKSAFVGDTSVKPGWKMEVTNKSQAEDGGKVLKEDTDMPAGLRVGAAGGRRKAAGDGETGDRATNGGRALRSREVKHSEEVKEAPNGPSTHTQTVPENRMKGSKAGHQVTDEHCNSGKEITTTVAKNTEAKEEPAGLRKLRRNDTVKTLEKIEERDSNVAFFKHANGSQLNLGGRPPESDSTNSSLLRKAVSEKEQGTSAVQTGTTVLRKTSSRKSAVSAQTDTSVEADPAKRNPLRTTRGSSVSFTGASVAKKSEQKMDMSMSSAEPAEVKKPKQASDESRTRKNGLDSGTSNTLQVNPFLISRAQTRLFSSRIREQAHRAWKLGHKSVIPARGRPRKDRGLTSGNTFRMASVSLASSTNSFSGKPKRLVNSAEVSKSLMLNQSATFAGAVSPPHTGARLSETRPVSPTRAHLSPKQMLSVLESTKGSSSQSVKKSKKESKSKNTGGHHSSAKHAVGKGYVRKSSSSPGSLANSQGSSAAGFITPRSTARRVSVQKLPVKSYSSLTKGSSSNLKSREKLRRQAKKSISGISSRRGGAGQRQPETCVSKVAGKRPISDLSGEAGTPHKKMRI
ncbi:uncharacterized protein LOC143299384 isoform X2 [Babylonia areolata]